MCQPPIKCNINNQIFILNDLYEKIKKLEKEIKDLKKIIISFEVNNNDKNNI